MGQEFYKSGKLTGRVEFDDPDVPGFQDPNMPKEDHGVFYMRKEGMAMTSGLGVMWDHKSRGFLLKIRSYYLWVRYSMRVKKLFVSAGKMTHGEVTE